MTSLEILLKATAILVTAFAFNRLMQRSPAALRHFGWTACFASLLLLPAAMLVGPRWSAPVAATMPQVIVSAPVAAQPPAPPPAAPFSLSTLWWAGFVLVAGRFLAGAARASWIVRRARPLGAEEGAPVVESPFAPMPMTWGIARPVIVLPPGSSAWPAERSRVVLLHELIHVRRRDLLAQTLAQAACCLYWFHPLAWIALRELRKERERACVDAELAAGVAAHDYASHLMGLVRALAGLRGSPGFAPAMAAASDLEWRIRAMLDPARNRKPLPRRAAFAVTVAALAAVLPLASVTSLAQGARGTLAGTVNDPSGARIPNATVRATNLDGGNRETIKANAAGEFRLPDVPAGRYALEFASPGFKLGKYETTLVAGATARTEAFLEIGSVSECLLIQGGPKVTAVAPSQSGTPQRIRVGGNVGPARLIQHVRPVYPPDCQQAGVEGTVMLTGIISKEGSLLSVKVVNTVDARLGQAALDAVRQWRYEPSRLNGQPVEVITNIELQFQLGQEAEKRPR
jgi:TonB family protein